MADVPNRVDPSEVPLPTADFFSADFLSRRRRAMVELTGPKGVDDTDPKRQTGHAEAIGTSTRLTSYFRRTHSKAAMDVTPQQVIDVLTEAGVKGWVLIELHGYVGYMPNPRATQDVDVMVRHSERRRAQKAITRRWPELAVQELSQVIRFCDSPDLDAQDEPKPVVDLMLPWAPFQDLILNEYVVVDPQTQHRLPNLDAAIVSKYASMISPYRDREKKEYGAGDSRRLVTANREQLKGEDLRRLGSLVWEYGGDEVERFNEIALTDAPFPI